MWLVTLFLLLWLRKTRTRTIPGDHPVAKDDVNGIVAFTRQQGWDAADEQKKRKPLENFERKTKQDPGKFTNAAAGKKGESSRAPGLEQLIKSRI